MSGDKEKTLLSEETEDEVIAINFKGQFSDIDFLDSVKNAKFYKLEDEEPLMQVGNQFFKCKPEIIFGTNVYFDIKSKDVNCSPGSSNSQPSSSRQSSQEASNKDKDISLEYLTKTTKSYETRRVFLEKKNVVDDQTD